MGESKKSIGAISSCRYDGKELTVSGSLSNDASVQYYGSKIFLYAIPASAVPSYDLSELSPIAQTGFSTKFRISADLDRTYAEYFYLTVLDTKEGLLPIGGLTAPAGGQVSATATNAVSAIHGADAADLFET
ncbi:MAG: hypothetical protein IJD22_00145, partial [Clostridia bacterium]|nr:hypothetical protein [Clostridia bacterium]